VTWITGRGLQRRGLRHKGHGVAQGKAWRACKIGERRATSLVIAKEMAGAGGAGFLFWESCFNLVFNWGWIRRRASLGRKKGGNEAQVWAGGGHSVPGGTQHTEAFDAGARYGWVITGEHWPGILRGRF